MPIANYEQYCKMLDNAQKNNFAYPAINVSSMTTANGALEAFSRMKCDGIIQVSTGGGEFASGLDVKDAVIGSISIAQHVHLLAEKYNILIALHTDHCQANKVDTYLKPLIAETAKRRKIGLPNLFNSHMFDGSAVSLEENMQISKELLALCKENEIILEVEAGVVGGEEDGVDNENTPSEKLYTTKEDMMYVYEQLNQIGGRYMFAATFGNVHGVYKPGNVKLKPSILKEGQDALKERFGNNVYFDLVFHGGSGSELSDIHQTLEYGVIKMNIDTDTQYTFTRPIVDHVMKNYDGMLKIEGEVGNKKVYDPRAYLKKGEEGMCQRIIQAIKDLKAENTTIYK